ncbi:MAG: phosphatase PAP2 family protein [Cytophagales bacterium]|nr:phosphatase PAP2 family protein [Cytophagales bacterium]
MIEQLKNIDEQLFIWLNGLGHPALDGIMIFLSAKLVWIPLYGLLLFLLYKHYGIQFWKPLLAVVIVIVIADQTTSGFMKPFFERLRPCRDPLLEGLVINVGKCGGNYGFASSHAANTFGLASIFFFLTLNKKYFWLFAWAGLVSYSRVYLGVHFPGDILVGGIIGLGAGWLVAHIMHRFLLLNIESN